MLTYHHILRVKKTPVFAILRRPPRYALSIPDGLAARQGIRDTEHGAAGSYVKNKINLPARAVVITFDDASSR